MNTIIKYLLVMLASIAIAACGGGGGGDDDPLPPAPPATYTISGAVTGAAGVTVSLSGAATATTTIAADGSYSFAGLANGTYTVTPSLDGYAFSPSSTVVAVSGANVTGKNFTATAAAATYSISGTVSGASSVTIKLSGANTASVTTGGDGSYTIYGLVPGGYTVTPEKSGYTFAPSSTDVTIVAANSTDNNFTATAIPVAHTISGAVSGAIKAGVTITVSGAADKTATTDTDGNYTVAGLYDGNYTLTPSLDGYVFEPSSTSVTMSGADVTGQNFTSTVYTAPLYSISGAVSGPYVAGVTIKLGGDGNAAVTTNDSGNYTFPNLPAGTYTVTPALAGYSYSPAAPSVTITDAKVTQDFVASSAVASYSVSGTVTYTGSKTPGRVYLRSIEGWQRGTSIALSGTPGNYTGTYTIRGLPQGTYMVAAEMDTLGTGVANATNPAGTSSPIEVSSDVSGVNITLADATLSTPPTPANVKVFPSDGAAFVTWDPDFNANDQESASTYKVSWGNDANASNGTGSPVTVTASDNGMQILRGLVNGTPYYFKVSALAGGLESAPSAPVAVTIGNVAGGNAVSGTVTFPGTTAGTLMVGLFQEGVGIHFTTLPNPVSPQIYTISGVPAGTYYCFAGIDANNNGVFDTGEMGSGEGTVVTVSGATTNNLTLSVNPATASVGTNYTFDGTSGWYNLSPRIDEEFKRPMAVTLVSGKNVAVPVDIAKENWGGFATWLSLYASPAVGDAYLFQVTYSDGATELLSASVTGVLGNSALPQNLAVVTNGTGGISTTVPLFTWSAPTAAPVSYTYNLSLHGTNWWYDDLPSTTLQALYNENGEANTASLTPGVPYTWQVQLRDANGNSATRQAIYTP